MTIHDFKVGDRVISRNVPHHVGTIVEIVYRHGYIWVAWEYTKEMWGREIPGPHVPSEICKVEDVQ